MNQQITDLDKQGYLKFGLTTSAILVVLFGLAIPYLFNFSFPKWPWILAGILTTWALIAPMTMRLLYRGWMKFGFIMNWINTRLILGILFYGLFLPFGIFFKLAGKDPMRRKLDKSLESYKEHNALETKNNLEKPY